jgi:catechol 2,3-dioxygenase-like lactoylglutathione lyase family enzyme
MARDAAPPLDGVLETALYVDDMERARAFYEGVLGLEAMFADSRLTAYPIGGRSALLLFRRGAATEAAHLPGGTIPPHDGAGPIHCALSIAADALPAWERRLAERGVAIEGRTEWPSRRPVASVSIYFRDPDGHLLELATPGLWPLDAAEPANRG